MSTRHDRTAVSLVVAGVLLAGLGLLYEIAAPSTPPAPAVSASTPTGQLPVPKTADDSPVAAIPLEEAERVRDASAKPGSNGAVRTADPLPAAPVTSSPDRIVVPGLSVDAPVVPISASGGVLVPPSDPLVIGWWSAGARPGAATGTAVLTGHTVSTGGGAFDDLDRMRPGQRLRIDSGSSSTDYVVRSVTVYRKQSLAEHATEIFNQGVRGRVALVTCEDWNGSSYLSNAVVIAVPTR